MYGFECKYLVFTSDEAGNGKTHEINKIIRNDFLNREMRNQREIIHKAESRARNTMNQGNVQNFDPNKPLKDKLEEQRIQNLIRNMDPVEKSRRILNTFEKIVISGFISPELIKRRMMKIKESRKNLRFLYIEIDYIENLDKQGYLLNDFLFNVCVLRFFSFDEEPFFLPNDIEIFIEVSPYLGNLLYNQIVNLKLFNRKNLTFDLKRFDFNKNCEFILDARIVTQIYLENLKSGGLGNLEFNATRFLIPYRTKGKKMESNTANSLIAFQQFEQFMEAYTELLLKPGKEMNIDISFSLVKLFTKILSHELRNLNANGVYMMSDDYRRLKVDLMRLVSKLVLRNIQPSVRSKSKQENADKAEIGKKK